MIDLEQPPEKIGGIQKKNQLSSVNIPAITEDSFEVKGEAIDASPSRTTWGWSISSICFNISWIFFYKNKFVARKNKKASKRYMNANTQIFTNILVCPENRTSQRTPRITVLKFPRPSHSHGICLPIFSLYTLPKAGKRMRTSRVNCSSFWLDGIVAREVFSQSPGESIANRFCTIEEKYFI